jgi:membrane associated rhomboid family serine protease
MAPCSWHPDRATPLSCSRCGRPACPECLTPASVGFHCRECIAQGRAATRAPRTIAGARVGVKPVVTIALIVVNLAFFLVTALQARSAMVLANSELYLRGGLIPAEVGSGEYWRLLTAGFLHGNLIHLATNMLSLYWLGVPMERILGGRRMLTLYLLSLFGASVAVLLFTAPVSITVGASGAVYGLMGALLVTFRRLKLNLQPLVVVLALNVFITFTYPGLSWQGHLGGFVIGAVVGAAMVFPPPATRRAWQWGAGIGVAVVLMVLTVIASGQIGSWYCFYQVAGDVSCLPAP